MSKPAAPPADDFKLHNHSVQTPGVPIPSPAATPTEVGKWLASIGAAYAPYATNATDHHLDGSLLHDIANDKSMDTTEECFRAAGISNRLHIRVIVQKVRGWKAPTQK